MYIGFNVNLHTPYYCQILVKFEFSRIDFRKLLKYRLHENSPSGSRVFPCGRTDRQTDMTKLTIAVRSFEKASKTMGETAYNPNFPFTWSAKLKKKHIFKGV